MAGVLRQGMAGWLGLVLAAVVAGAIGGAVGTANAQDVPKQLSDHRDWTAYTHDTAKGKVCFMASRPKQSKGNYSKRGEIYAMITHRPGENVRDEVSLAAGYEFPQGGQPVINIGGTRFTMISQGEHAWAPDAATDKKIVESMRGGATMVVTGKSARGTETTDTYSLNGFSAAYNAISAACR